MTAVSSVSVAPTRRRAGWYAVPLTLLVAAAVLANGGVDPTPQAVGASTDSVVTTATVGGFLDVQDQCSGAMPITVVGGAYADGVCAINFGSTNDATTTLRASSSAGAFLSPAGFADEGATCANLSAVDEAGLKVAAVGGGVTVAPAWGCAVGAATNNTTTAHKGVPDTFTNMCVASTMVINNSCTLGIGVFEVGSNATPGAYTGTLNLDVVG
jgi:hypothetical protein